MGITRSGSDPPGGAERDWRKISEEWVEEALVFGYVFLPRPPEKLCTQETYLEHCTLAGAGVRYRSARKLKRKFRVRFIHHSQMKFRKREKAI
jgi:hypothetical protein